MLFVPQASEDLLFLGKITEVCYKAIVYKNVLELVDDDAARMNQVAPKVSAVNSVFSLSLWAAERSEAIDHQVNETLQKHGAAPEKALSAFPRVVSAKHVGEENMQEGQGQAYINHCKFGHKFKAGAAARLGLIDIPSGTCPRACLRA